MKRFILLILVSLLFATEVYSVEFGPFTVKKIDGKNIYFDGKQIEGLNIGSKYRFFQILSKKYPTSITDVRPIGLIRVNYITETGGILKFKKSKPEEKGLKPGDRFLLIKGRKLLFNSAIRKVAEKEKRLMILDITASGVYYSSDMNYAYSSVSFQFFRLLSSIGFEFKIGMLNVATRDETFSDNGNGVFVQSYSNVVYQSGFVSMLVGVSDKNFSLMGGPILGVTNKRNSYGFDSLFRYGEIGGSYVQLNLSSIPESQWFEAGFEFKVDIDLKPGGAGIIGKYRPTSLPSTDFNNQILFGYSYTKEKSHFDACLGYSMSGKDKRGPAIEFSWGTVF